MTMSKTMEKFFDDLHWAEFGYRYGEAQPVFPKENKRAMVKLLRRSLSWKTHKNLQAVCVYLGAECDERIESVEGCKAIIKEDLDYWKNH